MPIYAYRCETCGHAKDVLQKISDPVLDTCPACGAASFRKQVTAAGFQLKGSGWYVTDFRGGDTAKGKAADAGTADQPVAADKAGAAAKPTATESGSAAAPASATAPADAKPAPAPAASPPPAASS